MKFVQVPSLENLLSAMNVKGRYGLGVEGVGLSTYGLACQEAEASGVQNLRLRS